MMHLLLPSTLYKVGLGRHTPLFLDDHRRREDFLKRQIRFLDRSAGARGGGYWGYGWDTVRCAAERNGRRCYLETIAGRKRRVGALLRYEALEIVPKSL